MPSSPPSQILPLPQRFSCLAAISFLLILLASQVSRGGDLPDWPQVNGPAGNYTPPATAADLLNDTADARQVWLSETDDLGYAKGSVSGYLQNLARWPGHPGSSSGPILADGKIFVTSFRPTGEPWADQQPQYQSVLAKPTAKPFTELETKALKQNLRILADDITIAIDASTGKTVWQAIEAGRGLNRYMGKRQGFCVSPAYSEGRLFSVGTTGLLYAYDASTGEKLWEADLGPAREMALAQKERSLEQRVLPSGMGWDVSLVVADDVLIVPLFDGADVSLRGVDIRSGKTLWEVAKACSRHATPAVWTHAKREYLLTATVSGLLQLIDPQTGKVLWKIEGLGPNHFSLTPTANHVFVNAGSSTPRKAGDDDKFGLLAAYKIDPEGAKLAWKHPDKPEFLFHTWMDSCARRFLAVSEGHVYFRAQGVEKTEQSLLMLDENTGKVVAQMEIASPALQYYPVGDRLLVIRDGSHSETHLGLIQRKGDELVQLCNFWSPPQLQTTAYEVLMEYPVVDGQLFLRTQDGRVARYDLTIPKDGEK